MHQINNIYGDAKLSTKWYKSVIASELLGIYILSISHTPKRTNGNELFAFLVLVIMRYGAYQYIISSTSKGLCDNNKSTIIKHYAHNSIFRDAQLTTTWYKSVIASERAPRNIHFGHITFPQGEDDPIQRYAELFAFSCLKSCDIICILVYNLIYFKGCL